MTIGRDDKTRLSWDGLGPEDGLDRLCGLRTMQLSCDGKVVDRLGGDESRQMRQRCAAESAFLLVRLRTFVVRGEHGRADGRQAVMEGRGGRRGLPPSILGYRTATTIGVDTLHLPVSAKPLLMTSRQLGQGQRPANSSGTGSGSGKAEGAVYIFRLICRLYKGTSGCACAGPDGDFLQPALYHPGLSPVA